MANLRSAAWLIPAFALTVLAGCVTPPPAAPVVATPAPPRVDDRMDGVWAPLKAEIGGRDYRLPPEYRLQIRGTRYTTLGGGRPDAGSLEFFATEPAGINVQGEEGPMKDRQLMAIYRFNAPNELEICYDLSGTTQPTAFESKPETRLFRITYRRVP